MFKKDVITTKQVHEEFDNAQDELLQEAQSIINNLQTSEDEEKEIEELKKLGFTGLDKVVTYTEHEKKKKISVELAKTIQYYRDKYPNNSFITEEKLKFICNKYGLIIGKPWDFKGNIPADKRKEMLNFKVDAEDKIYFIQHYVQHVQSYRHTVSYKEYLQKRDNDNYDTECDDVLSVVATPDLFDLEKKEIKNFRITRIKEDPIILYPVNKGYLIVSKWGKEENLEEL